jgi:hypothetical protein
MRSWILAWLFPVGLLGTVALLSLSNTFGWVLAMAWGLLVLPCIVAYVCSHPRIHRGGSTASGFADTDTNYWRTKLM